MLHADKMMAHIEHSNLIVNSLMIKEEMFFPSDLQVEAEVIVDNYPEGNLPYNNYHTELFRLSSPAIPSPSYKRTEWKSPDGSPAPPYSEVSIVLDFALRAFLVNRFNAELYDLTTISLPPARMLGPWWRCLLARLRRK